MVPLRFDKQPKDEGTPLPLKIGLSILGICLILIIASPLLPHGCILPIRKATITIIGGETYEVTFDKAGEWILEDGSHLNIGRDTDYTIKIHK